ncbi:response regulator [Skermanella mucosa]|uniref:hybrid sensor histidine kinase/response regulator n=1 Tax=Skermanella mucosa TaxID=1789672 RepID=UPI00192CA983|nr:ATP-binding protein [Skermanella mucosa]UEM22358.1 response regulator [Skermanella mucosa]
MTTQRADHPDEGLGQPRASWSAPVACAILASAMAGLTLAGIADWPTMEGLAIGLGIGAAAALALWRRARDAERRGQAGRRAEASAMASLTRLREAIDSVPGGFMLLDAAGAVVFGNAEYLGARGELAPAPSPASAPRDAPWEETLGDGRVLLIDRRRTAGGDTVSVFTDITAQKQAEHLLRHRLTALEASADGVAILDQAGTFTYLNDSHARMHGFDDTRDLLGRSWLSLYAAAERIHLQSDALPRLIEEGRWRGEVTGRRRDGSTFAQDLTLTALDDGGMVYIVRDISERRRAEEERARLTEQFHQAQKLEAIGRLAGGIAHDFNNILAAMMGYASFLVEDLDPAAPEHEFAVQLMVAGERAKRLVQQILAFSRSEGVERETVNMIAVLDETVALLRATLPKSINLTCRVDAVSALVHANPTQMSQVLMNLCVNAADAIGTGPGELALEIDMPTLDGGCAEGLREALDLRGDLIPARMGPGERPGSTCMWIGVLPINRDHPVRYVRLTVSDNGSGMPVEVMGRMLEPFFTTKGIGKGTGLGLAAVHGIVSAHRGAMMVESKPGEGTRFQVYLPTLEGAVVEQAHWAANAPRGSERILIVDDEDMVSSVIAQGLERLGYEVGCCISAEEALSVIREEPGAWDLVISDQMMPGMSGQELAARLAEDFPRLPVILCSGYGDPVTELGLDPEIGQILIKPVEAGILAQTVRRMLDQR